MEPMWMNRPKPPACGHFRGTGRGQKERSFEHHPQVNRSHFSAGKSSILAHCCKPALLIRTSTERFPILSEQSPDLFLGSHVQRRELRRFRLRDDFPQRFRAALGIDIR